ncbi:SIR2 family protein [Leptospira levettii]|uniref:SIR2 family protein n=2 Tax=Leptospira levettii TaxID=2023178 RepID=A0AAW5VG94_9LEPT|nr:SIR2 family protein [Leptospira levettii]MCW7517270.1 SIR2 family protein [Leptospira levettii]
MRHAKKSLQEYKMSKIVIIFGAGCSVASGAPLMNNFIDKGDKLAYDNPDSIDIQSFNLVKKARQELQRGSIKSNIDIHNIEDFFTAFELASVFGQLGDLDQSNIDNLSIAMKKFIIQTIENSITYKLEKGFIRPHSEFNTIANFIHSLLDKKIIKNLSEITLITFNYDLNLEIALHYNNIPFSYSFSEETNIDCLKVLKLHGSINWAKDQNNNINEVLRIKDIMNSPQHIRQNRIPIRLSNNISINL